MSENNGTEEFLKRVEERKKSKRRKKTIVASAAVALVVITAGNIFFGYDRVDGNKTIEIEKGTSLFGVADILKKEKVISKKTKFIAEAIISGNSSKLKFGSFEFKDGMSYGEIVDTIVKGGAKKETVKLVIPEGYSVENIKRKMAEVGLGDEKSIEKALQKNYDYDFLKSVPSSPEIKYKLQGFLFPSTYEFYADAEPEYVIDTMLKKFDEEYKKVSDGSANVYDVVTIASIIEREAKLDSERETVSGVIKNRLDKGMKLQMCATVLYAVTDGIYDKQKVYYSDLETKSLYNTYMYDGLPVGPISNPGISSIKAALNPQKHDYMYYHTNEEKNDGSHIFTKTYDEHEQTLGR